jgi:hypothetical protein
MEAIKATVSNIQQNEQTQTLSRQAQSSTTISQISREEHLALFQLINKTRMLNGWTTKTAQELDATIRTWFEIFVRYKIPVGAYSDLYFRAFETRQSKQRRGEDVPQADATLLVSCWTGEHGLEREMEKKRIEQKKFLPATAESVCPKCFGTGTEIFKDTEGYEGARRCNH